MPTTVRHFLWLNWQRGYTFPENFAAVFLNRWQEEPSQNIWQITALARAFLFFGTEDIPFPRLPNRQASAIQADTQRLFGFAWVFHQRIISCKSVLAKAYMVIAQYCKNYRKRKVFAFQCINFLQLYVKHIMSQNRDTRFLFVCPGFFNNIFKKSIITHSESI